MIPNATPPVRPHCRGRQQGGIPTWCCATTKNQIYSVRYEAVNAMLLNEFLKEHKKVEAQNTQIQELQARLDRMEQILDRKIESAP